MILSCSNLVYGIVVFDDHETIMLSRRDVEKEAIYRIGFNYDTLSHISVYENAGFRKV